MRHPLVAGLAKIVFMINVSISICSAKPLPIPNARILDMPSEPWPYIHNGKNGPETYLIPSQLAELRRLPEPQRSSSLRFVREHQANLSFLRETMNSFFSHLRSGKLHANSEYTSHLDVVTMGVDFENANDVNPILAHEPVLRALPPYTRVLMLTPERALPKVKMRLNILGMGHRVRLVVSKKETDGTVNSGITRWVRDIMFVTHNKAGTTILTSLAHKDFEGVSHQDIGYLTRISAQNRQVLRLPLFFRGGNLLVASKGGHTILLVGSDELAMNQQWFVSAFGFSPPAIAIPEIIKAAVGADEVVIIPNSATLFHLDTFVTPLSDGVVGLLAPMDAQRMNATDGGVLLRTRESLQQLGFHLVDIPTSVQRMNDFQSPTNMVPFIDRTNGHHRALIPQFPEPSAQDPSQSLNARVIAAYRSAGIDPIPVEDRFYVRGGNTHCALLSLH